MDENDYLEKRLQDQIDWYDRKSQIAQRWFKRLRGFELIAATAIPLLAGYSSNSVYLTLAVGFAGVLVAVAAGLLSLNQFQERWVEYRTTSEALKREQYLFLARADPYDGEHPFPLLVERVESLIAKETSAWGQYIRSAGKPKAPSAEAAVSPQEEVQWSERYEAVAVAADTAADESLNASDTVFDRVKEGARDVANLLPEEVGDKIVVMASKAEQGVEIVRDVVEAGSTLAAVAKAQEVFGGSAQASPLKAIVEKALASFTPALGIAVPPIGLIMALGTVGMRLGGAAYEKWKARVLHLPFSPASGIPLQVVDANTGFSLLQQSPIFRTAFSKRMRDRKFLKSAAVDFVQVADMNRLWHDYGQRGQFASCQEFEQGLEEFHRAVADAELQAVIDPAWLEPAGDYQQLLSDVDKIHHDPEASADLDALMTTMEKLCEENEPVLDMLDEIRKEKDL